MIVYDLIETRTGDQVGRFHSSDLAFAWAQHLTSPARLASPSWDYDIVPVEIPDPDPKPKAKARGTAWDLILNSDLD